MGQTAESNYLLEWYTQDADPPPARPLLVETVAGYRIFVPLFERWEDWRSLVIRWAFLPPRSGPRY